MSTGSTIPTLVASGANWLDRGAGYYPDPFEDLASMALPRTVPDALRWSERVFVVDGIYRQAMRRVASYFITDIDVESPPGKELSDEARQKFGDYLRNQFKIREATHAVAADYLCYGISLSTLLMPFRRSLICPGRRGQYCGARFPLRLVYENPLFKFAWTDYEFQAECPSCGYRGPWERRDDPEGESGRLRLHRWNPHFIDILHDPLTGDKRYIWRIPEYYRKFVREGKLHFLERVPWDVVQAIKQNKPLELAEDIVYSMMDPVLAGMDTAGWGVAGSLINSRQIWRNQLLARMNEAVCADYIAPLRVITPGVRPSALPGMITDPLANTSMHQFVHRWRQILRARRRDPAGWYISPDPVDYKIFGGEANSLAPYQLLEQGIDTLLNSSGVPAELYKSTLQVQAAPAALRLFESNWGPFVDQLNGFVNHVADRTSMLLKWEPVDCRMKKVTISDDINRQMAQMQLMLSNVISYTTGLASLGIDWRQEMQRIMNEQRYKDDLTRKLQADMTGSQLMQQFAQANQQNMQAAVGNLLGGGSGGGPPGGGQPGAAAPESAGGAAPGGDMTALPPPDVPQSPQALMAYAQQIAQGIAAIPNQAQRRARLTQLKQMDPSGTIAALVKDQLRSLRSQAASAGQQQLIGQGQQQQQPKAASAPPRRVRGLMTRGFNERIGWVIRNGHS